MQLTSTQAAAMLRMQDAINSRINPKWRDQKNPWYRAAWVECAELMEHVGWKWWKKQTPSVEQIELELVDIWHFGLSDLLQNDTSEAARSMIVNAANSQASYSDSALEQLSLIESFALTCLADKRFPLTAFFRLADSWGLSGERLFVSYAGKNILNRFRQDHGYADGTYVKVWHGKEDNEYLASLRQNLDPNTPTYDSDLYEALAQTYRTVSRR